jgi:hypothetical protein
VRCMRCPLRHVWMFKGRNLGVLNVTHLGYECAKLSSAKDSNVLGAPNVNLQKSEGLCLCHRSRLGQGRCKERKGVAKRAPTDVAKLNHVHGWGMSHSCVYSSLPAEGFGKQQREARQTLPARAKPSRV